MNSVQYRIFVAGIPAGVKSADLLQVFEVFGEVVKLDRSLANSDSSDGDRISSRGHCVLHLRDEKAMTRILNSGPHFIRGRRIICREYLEGSQLLKQNTDHNRRRVILKKVPAKISEAEVRQGLTKAFGPIETMFRFLSDSSKGLAIQERTFSSYSVMFKSVASAFLASQSQIFLINGIHRTIIERFKKSKQTARQVFQSTTRKLAMSTLATRVKPKGRNLSLIRNGLPKNKGIEQIPRAFSYERDLKKYDRTGFKRHQFALELMDYSSKVKPTSKIYSEIRKEDFEYLASFYLKNTWTSINNIRLNIPHQF